MALWNYTKKTLLKLIPDKLYLKLKFKKRMGKKLNLKKPQTFNEKLQWLKLYNRKPIYTKMVDKYEVKKLVSEEIGVEYIIPTYGVYNKFEEINFDDLPDQFVIKCTHDSGGVIICKNKSNLNILEAKKKMNDSLKKNYFYGGREWPYKNVKPRIIIEQFIEDTSGEEIKDYKWFCFNGEPKIMFVASDRNNPNEETKVDFYDMDFNQLNIMCKYPNSNQKIEKPREFEKMKELAKRLSQNIPHVRIDFYNVGEKIYFGEFTFFHWSGMMPFNPEEWDYKLGSWIELPFDKKDSIFKEEK